MYQAVMIIRPEGLNHVYSSNAYKSKDAYMPQGTLMYLQSRDPCKPSGNTDPFTKQSGSQANGDTDPMWSDYSK